MAALTAPHRFLVFSVIDSLMARYRDGLSWLLYKFNRCWHFVQVLKAMRKEFLSGYIALADGEKDPRNLLTAFAIARVILVEFDISDHIEVRSSSYWAGHRSDRCLLRPCSTLRFAIFQSHFGRLRKIHMELVLRISKWLFGKLVPISSVMDRVLNYPGHVFAPHHFLDHWLFLFIWRSSWLDLRYQRYYPYLIDSPILDQWQAFDLRETRSKVWQYHCQYMGHLWHVIRHEKYGILWSSR